MISKDPLRKSCKSLLGLSLNLEEAAGGVSYPHGEDPLPQQGVDGSGLAVAGAAEEGHLHVVPLQHLPDTGHLPAYEGKHVCGISRFFGRIFLPGIMQIRYHILMILSFKRYKLFFSNQKSRAVDPAPHGSAFSFPPGSGNRKNARKLVEIVILL